MIWPTTSSRQKDQNFNFLKVPYICRIDSRPIFFIVGYFFLAKSLQKNCLYLHEKLQRKPFVGRGLNVFIFWPYRFENLRFLTNARKGAMRSKTQWVFYNLQGTRLMAWTTKRPIRGNHWILLGCKALLGSVKPTKNFKKSWARLNKSGQYLCVWQSIDAKL